MSKQQGGNVKIALWSVLGLFGFTALIIYFSGLNYGLYSFFAPKMVAVDNKVFHESQAYNDGMVRDLENLKLQYMQADDAGKAALRATVLHRFSVYPNYKMPPDLQNFYATVGGM